MAPLSSKNTLQVVISSVEKYSKIHWLEDFTIRWPIGVGGFSTVVEVWKNSSGKIYAMKMIKKEMKSSRNKSSINKPSNSHDDQR